MDNKTTIELATSEIAEIKDMPSGDIIEQKSKLTRMIEWTADNINKVKSFKLNLPDIMRKSIDKISKHTRELNVNKLNVETFLRMNPNYRAQTIKSLRTLTENTSLLMKNILRLPTFQPQTVVDAA